MGSVSPFGVDTFQSGYHTKNEKKKQNTKFHFGH